MSCMYKCISHDQRTCGKDYLKGPVDLTSKIYFEGFLKLFKLLPELNKLMVLLKYSYYFTRREKKGKGQR